MNCPICGAKLELINGYNTLCYGLENENIHNMTKSKFSHRKISASFDYYVCNSDHEDSHKDRCFFKGKRFTYVWNNREKIWQKILSEKVKVVFT